MVDYQELCFYLYTALDHAYDELISLDDSKVINVNNNVMLEINNALQEYLDAIATML
jgi:hypothetical protein